MAVLRIVSQTSLSLILARSHQGLVTTFPSAARQSHCKEIELHTSTHLTERAHIPGPSMWWLQIKTTQIWQVQRVRSPSIRY